MANDLPLAGTGALITGGGSGIGLGSARHLLRDGATVTLFGRDEDRLATGAASLADDTPAGAAVRTSPATPAPRTTSQRAVAVAGEGAGLHWAVLSAGTGTMAPGRGDARVGVGAGDGART